MAVAGALLPPCQYLSVEFPMFVARPPLGALDETVKDRCHRTMPMPCRPVEIRPLTTPIGSSPPCHGAVPGHPQITSNKKNAHKTDLHHVPVRRGSKFECLPISPRREIFRSKVRRTRYGRLKNCIHHDCTNNVSTPSCTKHTRPIAHKMLLLLI